jgi:hypothetical protein
METDITQYLKKANFYFENKNYIQSELFTRKLLNANPNDIEGNLLLRKIIDAYGLEFNFSLLESDTLKRKYPRYLLIKAWGFGFWSEVHHVMTQCLLAELLNRTPIVLWGRNCIFRAESDLNSFTRFFKNINTVELDELRRDLTFFPKKWSFSNIYEEDLNKWEGVDSRIGAQYFFNRKEDIVVIDFYSTLDSIIPWIGEESKYYGKSEDQLYAELFQKYLKPADAIQAEVDQFYENYMSQNQWLGVHIRGGDKVYEYKDPEHLKLINDYIFETVNKLVQSSLVKVFLLTDSDIFVKEMRNQFADKVITTNVLRTSSNIGVHHSGMNGILLGKEVLVDALLATKCDYFVGNNGTNVSLAIASMKQWIDDRLYIFDTHKSARGENIFLHDFPKY